MAIVCLDSNILVWGIRKDSTPGQEAKIKFAEELFSNIADEKHSIIIPAICVAEASIGVTDRQDAGLFIKKLQQVSIIKPFDALCALRYYDVYNQHANKMPDWQANEGCRRINLATDIKILATALANRADILYTDNLGDFNRIADGFDIQIQGLPTKIVENICLPLEQEKIIQ